MKIITIVRRINHSGKNWWQCFSLLDMSQSFLLLFNSPIPVAFLQVPHPHLSLIYYANNPAFTSQKKSGSPGLSVPFPAPPHLHHTHLHSDSLWTATSIQGQALWLFISIFQGLVPAFLPPITHVLNVLESGFYSHCHKETKFTESKMTSQLLISKACLLDPSNRWVILFCKLPILCQQVSHSLLPSLPVSPNFQPWPLLCSCSSFFLKITFSLTVGTLGPQI
jgi:hypothetical protein